jgi:Putative adhesin
MRTFESPEPISVDVELGVGDIHIEAADRTDTSVEVRPRDPSKKSDVAAAEQTRVEYANGHLLVKAPSGWHHWTSRRPGALDVRSAVPEGSRVSAETGVVGIRVSGRLGELRGRFGVGDVLVAEAGPVDVKTGAGDVTIGEVVGKANVVTGSGSLRIDRVEGTGALKNSNGDTSLGEVTGDIRISAANGTISLDRAGESVVAKTARGDVRIGEVAHRTVVAQTAMGTIEVGVRDGVAAWLDLQTNFGEVRNDLEDSPSPVASEDTVEVHASTSFGDVVVRRSSASRA